MLHRISGLFPAIVLGILLMAAALQAQEPVPADHPLFKLDWQKGPTTAKVGGDAAIAVPEGFMFTGPQGAQDFLEILQNIPSGEELGLLTTPKFDWFVIFSFDDVGYVKDDEKDSLNADEMLASIREGTEEANEERRRRGWTTMTVTGWVVKPHYETVTSNLEWSLTARDDEDGDEAVNHHTRYLGRRGVMNAELVADTKDFETTLAEFREVMKGYSYDKGSDYQSFVPGDKVAEYGLTALVLGGGAAAAAKMGLLKSLWKMVIVGWKFVVAGLIAAAAAIRKFFAGRAPKPAEEAEPTS